MTKARTQARTPGTNAMEFKSIDGVGVIRKIRKVNIPFQAEEYWKYRGEIPHGFKTGWGNHKQDSLHCTALLV